MTTYYVISTDIKLKKLTEQKIAEGLTLDDRVTGSLSLKTMQCVANNSTYAIYGIDIETADNKGIKAAEYELDDGEILSDVVSINFLEVDSFKVKSASLEHIAGVKNKFKNVDLSAYEYEVEEPEEEHQSDANVSAEEDVEHGSEENFSAEEEEKEEHRAEAHSSEDEFEEKEIDSDASVSADKEEQDERLAKAESGSEHESEEASQEEYSEDAGIPASQNVKAKANSSSEEEESDNNEFDSAEEAEQEDIAAAYQGKINAKLAMHIEKQRKNFKLPEQEEQVSLLSRKGLSALATPTGLYALGASVGTSLKNRAFLPDVNKAYEQKLAAANKQFASLSNQLFGTIKAPDNHNAFHELLTTLDHLMGQTTHYGDKKIKGTKFEDSHHAPTPLQAVLWKSRQVARLGGDTKIDPDTKMPKPAGDIINSFYQKAADPKAIEALSEKVRTSPKYNR